jgi:hypothetical protein
VPAPKKKTICKIQNLNKNKAEETQIVSFGSTFSFRKEKVEKGIYGT